MAVADDKMTHVRAYLEYFRDMGVHDFYRNETLEAVELPVAVEAETIAAVAAEPVTAVASAAPVTALETLTPTELNIAKLVSFNDLAPMPAARVAAELRTAAL